MLDFICGVKERSKSIDDTIVFTLKHEDSVNIDYLVEHVAPINVISNRLDILSRYGVIRVEGDRISRGRSFESYKRMELPLNASDLGLGARDKLVILVLRQLSIADIDTIFSKLHALGDHIKRGETIYWSVKNLASWGILHEIRKDNPQFNIKGNKLYYKLKENIEPTENYEELFNQCKDFMRHRFKVEVRT